MIPRFLILVLILLLPQALWAQTSQLGQANGATVTALNAGENARALELAETAIALTETGSHPPLDHAFAINNLAYALALNGGEASRVQGLYDTALDLAEAHRPDTDPAIFLILQNAA